MSRAEPALDRVLVALDASAHGRAALAGAATLAAELRAELLGLFVEDANLLRLAALPFGGQAAWGPAAEDARDEQRMSRALRAEAARLRRLLEVEAERLHLRWSFQVTRGAVAHEVIEAAAGVDLVVMGTAGRNPMTGTGLGSTARTVARLAPRSVAFLRPGVTPGRPVAVFYDGSEAAGWALALAGRLAREDGRNLIALLPADAPRGRAALAGEVAARLGAAGLQARVRELAPDGPETLAATVRAAGVRLLVLPAGHALCEEGPLATLLDRAGCPVVIAR